MRFTTPALLGLALAVSATHAFAACATDIATFRALLASDAKIGHLNAAVYEKASADLAKAEALCKGGQDGAASSAVRATRSRYGYPNR